MHTRRTEFVKTIALIAHKGGVGKTTMAVSLAVASGLRTAIFDLDPQESAAMWADRRLAEGLKAAEPGVFELAIIDTPPDSEWPRTRCNELWAGLWG
jgi:chromosome partitioning protein